VSLIKTYIAGHRGMVGSALMRRYQRDPARALILRTRHELDLSDAAAVERFFAEVRPDEVLLAAGKVGGILANRDFPVEFLLDNLRIQNNVLAASHRFRVRKLLFLGSSCIYPKHAPQPIREDALLTGPLEPTNEAYALAKIAGIALAQSYRKQYGCNFISAVPAGLYGPGDNFDRETSHVLPALMRKLHEAKSNVTLWGSGSPRREFLHVDDLADACHLLMERYDSSDIINVGSGMDLSIRELAELIADVVDYRGVIEWDSSKPDGMPRKLLDASKMHALGWSPTITLAEGLRSTYAWFKENVSVATTANGASPGP
jgi:GDP-L-fucose synthase